MDHAVRLFYRVALPLGVVIACTTPPVASMVTCDPQSATRKYSAPWSELTNAELRDEVERACGRVFVGFKEAGAVRGVDPQGRNLTQASTVERMHAFLAERGIVLEFTYDLPGVSARMPARLDLVEELRRHANVDYLEPIFPGTRWGQ